MKFPEKYIERGEFILHSGQKSKIRYDVNLLLTDNLYVNHILNRIPHSGHYVGIVTGGAIIASLISREFNSKYSMIKDGELKGSMPDKYILIDDVTTTGGSLEEAINLIGKNPSQIVVVFDRRERNENPEVYSIFDL